MGLFRGILGILIGAGLYSEVYPFIQDDLLKLGDYGKLTIPSLIGSGPWLVIVPFAIVVSGVLLWMDRVDRGKSKT
jgi:uncharacterized protein